MFPATQNGLHCMYLNVVYSLYIFNLYRGSALLLTHEELLCSWGIELWITSQSNPIKKAPDRKCTNHQHACIYYTIYFNIKIHHTAFEHRQKQKAFCRILWDFSEDIKGLTVPKQSQTHCPSVTCLVRSVMMMLTCNALVVSTARNLTSLPAVRDLHKLFNRCSLEWRSTSFCDWASPFKLLVASAVFYIKGVCHNWFIYSHTRALSLSSPALVM